MKGFPRMATVKRIKCGIDNCYIVSEGSDAILVDTGSRANIDDVIKECDKYTMKLIVLTHVHFDHAENAAQLSKRYDIPVAMDKKDEELFESFDKQPLSSYGIVGRFILWTSLKLLRNTKVEKPENLIFVSDGDDLSSYGINAKILSLPGHTLGSVGVDVEDKDLIVGDELDNWLSPGIAHLFTDRDAAEKSAGRLRALGERTVYYGHGNPTPNAEY